MKAASCSKRPEPKETDIQAAILKALSLHPSVAFAHRMNAGAGKLVHGNGQSRFVRFGFPGMPDIMGMLIGGRALYIEVKRPSGVVSPEQRAFLARASENGAIAFVARSVGEVWDVLNGVAQEGGQKHQNSLFLPWSR